MNAESHAQRLADALNGFFDLFCMNENFDVIRQVSLAKSILKGWEDKESPADADALEALDQLEQLEGGE